MKSILIFLLSLTLVVLVFIKLATCKNLFDVCQGYFIEKKRYLENLLS